MAEAPEIIAKKFLNRTNRHLFLTGRAGTGKTTFLRSIIGETHKKAVIAAPTGVAAINAGGVTLHSLFQLPFGTYVPSDTFQFTDDPGSGINTPRTLMRQLHMHASKRRLIREIELLIIDEVSMLRADILDAIDRVMRSVRRRGDVSFGGVQVLFIGDLLQLPPVVKDEEWMILKNFYKSIHFFDALVLKEEPPLYLELEKIYRQSDPTFIDLLNHFRDHCVTREDVELLNRFYRPGFSPGRNEGYIHLTTHNRIADQVNTRELERLDTKAYTYLADIQDDFREHQYPLDPEMRLKKGAQVMFIKNDPSGYRRFFNGKIGFVTELDEEAIEVGFNDGSEPVLVERYTWYHKRYRLDNAANEIREEVLGTFTQYPLKLAWAVTVHKSQGLTFEKAIIDVERAFAPGQIYVALSRLVSLDGLVLSSPVPTGGFSADNDITAFSATRPPDHKINEILHQEAHRFVRNKVLESFDLTDLEEAIRFHLRSYDKDERRSAKQRYRSKMVEIQERLKPEAMVAEKFRRQVMDLTAGRPEGYLMALYERIQAAREYFDPKLKNFSGEIVSLIHELKDAVGVKQYLRELKELEAVFYSRNQQMHKSLALVDSLQNQRDLTREAYTDDEEQKVRMELVEAGVKVKKKGRGSKKGKTGKGRGMKKGDSERTSYEMFRDGMTIAQVAVERNITEATIERHLTEFIRRGELDILQVLDEEKVADIRRALKDYDGQSVTPVKKALGEEYSYNEIRMVLAAGIRD